MLIQVLKVFFMFAIYCTTVFLFNRMLDASTPNEIVGFAVSYAIVYTFHNVCVYAQGRTDRGNE